MLRTACFPALAAVALFAVALSAGPQGNQPADGELTVGWPQFRGLLAGAGCDED